MAGTRWTVLARVIAGIALCAYPVVVWLGLRSGSPRGIALVLLCIMIPAAAIRLRSRSSRELRGLAVVPLATILSLGLASALDSLGFILIVPVAINLIFLITFGSTLREGAVPMIERFARLQEEELTVEQQDWCLLWTRIWCGFFVLNGSIALALVLFAPVSWWAFYNGLLSYCLSGCLLGTEYLLRRRRFPSVAGGAPEDGRA